MADVVVDASVFVSRLLHADPNQAQSVAWFEHRDQDAFLVVPALLAPEVAGAIGRRLGNAQLARRATDRLLRIPALRVVPIDRSLGERAATLAADFRLRGADAIYVAVAERLQLPLVTWDHEQRDRAKRAVATCSPSA